MLPPGKLLIFFFCRMTCIQIMLTRRQQPGVRRANSAPSPSPQKNNTTYIFWILMSDFVKRNRCSCLINGCVRIHSKIRVQSIQPWDLLFRQATSCRTQVLCPARKKPVARVPLLLLLLHLLHQTQVSRTSWTTFGKCKHVLRKTKPQLQKRKQKVHLLQ